MHHDLMNRHNLLCKETLYYDHQSTRLEFRVMFLRTLDRGFTHATQTDALHDLSAVKSSKSGRA
jgi:hypothetical protein